MRKTLRSKGHTALLSVLVATRREKGLTQRQLAERLGKHYSVIAKVEAGERRLDVVEFIAWSKALKVEPEVLLGRVTHW